MRPTATTRMVEWLVAYSRLIKKKFDGKKEKNHMFL